MVTDMSDETNAKTEVSKWFIVTYAPVSLFSLRMTRATSKGGKTLLVPTPYSFKMALLDACFRVFQSSDAETTARKVFHLIKNIEIRFSPPSHCIVQNTFVKIRQEERDAPKGFFVPTIAYREFCFYGGDKLQVALLIDGLENKEIVLIETLCMHINCIGKRGSFWQYEENTILRGNLPENYTRSDYNNTVGDNHSRWLQELDDFGQPLCEDENGFDRISTYGKGEIKLGKHRVLMKTLIPYCFKRSSRHFTQYEKIQNE